MMHHETVVVVHHPMFLFRQMQISRHPGSSSRLTSALVSQLETSPAPQLLSFNRLGALQRRFEERGEYAHGRHGLRHSFPSDRDRLGVVYFSRPSVVAGVCCVYRVPVTPLPLDDMVGLSSKTERRTSVTSWSSRTHVRGRSP
jgi:hypothetical protein